MKMILYSCLLISCIFPLIISCNPEEFADDWEKYGFPGAYFSASSTLTFGQTFLQQVNSCTGDSSIFNYTLENQTEGMTISSKGFIEWTPNKASQITTHPNIKVTIIDANGNQI